MIPNALIVKFDTKKYKFREFLAIEVFKVPKLEYLHKYWSIQSKKTKLCYKDNLLLRRIMQNLTDALNFYKIYHCWVNNIIAVRYGHKISYSMHPKMRVHLSQTSSVSNFHRDVSVTNRQEQINVYLPFTDVFDGCTIWVENNYGSENYVPINLNYGQALIWDGGCLKHGSIDNNTEFTRISCDFRFHYFDERLVKEPYNQILSGRSDNLSKLI